ncbi:MAG TPA: 50S ribosomal protein L32e [Candidatus Caldiarchaeum subterraneum]|uniref:Large ribosomal subunit protein eL32 n=1 Tax=Caldiarchaeum subterraneum TaxID=311458 RepID=A0A832ZWK0_CALS0|nr:50S ribosomal protein L32e [Aigarchaeota archaeon]HIQ30088.1 50S ribosomal protein L32e [Candidatus Caldarchaeum subterraneum]
MLGLPIKIPRSVLEKRRKKPEFRRQESWRYVRLKPNWRRPRGKDSKMRLQVRGAPPLVKIGYGSPRKYRGLHPSGYREVLVHRPEDLEGINPDTEAARIAGGVGRLKRMKIMEAALERGIKVLNPLPGFQPASAEEGGEGEE